MIFSVAHVTTYGYSRAVFLEPHAVRLLPRPDPAQRILEHTLRFEPEPAGQARGLDLWGNGFVQIWFNDMHQNLRIESICRVQTLRANPFDFFLTRAAEHLPVELTPVERVELCSCLTRRYPGRNSKDMDVGTDPVSLLAGNLATQANASSMDFLLNLNRWIFEHVQRQERLEPGVLAPQRLLAEGVGSCRDLAVLFMEICREAGIPARFVSGYQEGDPDVPEAELHAWAEAYLPGIGWRGYDPTHGLVVADRHISLAAAPEPEQTMPLTGSFRGTGAFSTITHTVRMTPEAD
ncbi:transglutaminase family protein [Desulfonatronum thiodismutans]|uniref:transglutaminase family protein n=1 Tax=Desulfonatronum thiodismutans TaxID=159290 RepID=UPI0004ABED7B|nr:transglutaminase family protein [Desulfonatronum thiodismutans]